MRKEKETVAKQLRIVQVQVPYICSSKKVGSKSFFFKYGSVGQFFPLNVAWWRSGANFAEKTPGWCGGAMI